MFYSFRLKSVQEFSSLFTCRVQIWFLRAVFLNAPGSSHTPLQPMLHFLNTPTTLEVSSHKVSSHKAKIAFHKHSSNL